MTRQLEAIMPLKAVMPTDLRAPAPLPATEHTADGRNHVEAEDDRRRVGLKLDQKALDRKLRRVFS